jgi:hypothetical protein
MTRAASRGCQLISPFRARALQPIIDEGRPLSLQPARRCPREVEGPVPSKRYQPQIDLTENPRVGSSILPAASIKTKNNNIERAERSAATAAFRHVGSDRFSVPITRLAPRTFA